MTRAGVDAHCERRSPPQPVGRGATGEGGGRSQLGKGIPQEEAERFANGLQFPGLMARPSIVNLYLQSRAPAVLEALLGPTHPVGGGQIAYADRAGAASIARHAARATDAFPGAASPLSGTTTQAAVSRCAVPGPGGVHARAVVESGLAH